MTNCVLGSSRSRSSWSRTCIRPLRRRLTARSSPSRWRRFGALVDVDQVEVLFLDGRRSALNYLRGVRELRKTMARNRFDVVHAHHGLAGAVAVTQSQVTGGHYFSRQRSQLLRLAAVGLASRGVPCRCKRLRLGCRGDEGSPRGRSPPLRDRPRAFCACRPRRGSPEVRGSGRRDRTAFPGPRAHPQKAYSRFEEVRDALRSRRP